MTTQTTMQPLTAGQTWQCRTPGWTAHIILIKPNGHALALVMHSGQQHYTRTYVNVLASSGAYQENFNRAAGELDLISLISFSEIESLPVLAIGQIWQCRIQRCSVKITRVHDANTKTFVAQLRDGVSVLGEVVFGERYADCYCYQTGNINSYDLLRLVYGPPNG